MDFGEMRGAYVRAVDTSLRAQTRDVVHLLTEIIGRDEEGRDIREVCFQASTVIQALLGQIDELKYWAYEGAQSRENRDSLLGARMILKLNEGVFFGRAL